MVHWRGRVGRWVAEDRGVEGRREVEVAFLKRALEVTKSTGGREGLEGKSSADGGLGHGAEGLGLRQGLFSHTPVVNCY